uniref:Uncharacterized protein n=1 Tax=Panagrolaimus davidi TaxID=227884 RepID=A0A914R572_9BILA
MNYCENCKKSYGAAEMRYHFECIKKDNKEIEKFLKDAEEEEKKGALAHYRRKLNEHRDIDARLKELRKKESQMQKEHDKSENDIKALQSVGQIQQMVLDMLLDVVVQLIKKL